MSEPDRPAPTDRGSAADVPEVDPEDWARAGADDDDRYLRERPPHWQ